MNKKEFLQLSDDEKWDFARWLDSEICRLEDEVSRLNGSSFSEDDIIQELQGRLLRKLKKYEKMRVKSFFTYAKSYHFKWKNGNDMVLWDVSNYLFNDITKVEDIF